MAERLQLMEEDLKRYVDAAGEESHIDHKAAIEWDGAEHSAALAKDIMACANLRGGGAIVIGVREAGAGELIHEGVTDDQGKTFETTDVASWVNARCEPPVQLTCYKVRHRGASFVVIRVAEFDDVPIVCTRDYAAPDNPKKRLLIKGAIYIRTPGAASAPVQSADDLRPLVGLASTKKQDEMLAAIRSVIAGTSLVSAAEPAALYAEEENEMIEGVAATFKAVGRGGALLVKCYPVEYEAHRLGSANELGSLLNDALRVMGWSQFTNQVRGLNHEGLVSLGDQIAALKYSGFAVLKEGFYEEDARPFRGGRYAQKQLGPGEWIEYVWTLFRVKRHFLFMGRLAREFHSATQIAYEISATELKGRTLVTESPSVLVTEVPEPCLVPTFRRRGSVSAAEMIAGWQDYCADVLFAFMRLFHERITREVILKWIQK